MYFMGTFTPRLDEKGRLFLPAKWRDRLAAGVVVTRGQEKCLYVWPQDTFEAQAAEVMAKPIEQRSARSNHRSFFTSAEESTPDKQGRINLGALLRAYAGLTKEVAVVGVGDRIEIWDQERWVDYDAEAAEDYAGLDEVSTS
jgi:MraZ protein